tara:strand:- start:2 stop:178 length:177 start_codon:yes stop_codon:yes gene_type:complete
MSTEEKIIKPKLGLLELAKQLGNVSHCFNSIKIAGPIYPVLSLSVNLEDCQNQKLGKG